MDKVYKQFQNYDFEQSPSYKKTLEQVYNQYLIVLSDKDLEVKQDIGNGVFNPEKIPQPDREQLQLQTKIFVFCSETENIIELHDYQCWLESNLDNKNRDSESHNIEQYNDSKLNQHQDQDQNQNHDLTQDNNTININPISEQAQEEYTSNYQELVDMIVNNKPIPGIKQIPKTILDPSTASTSTLQQRKKPWEINDDQENIKPEPESSHI
jgi:hypothetical protein